MTECGTAAPENQQTHCTLASGHSGYHRAPGYGPYGPWTPPRPITLTTDEARLVASVLRYYAPTADYWNEDGPACRALAKRLEEAAS